MASLIGKQLGQFILRRPRLERFLTRLLAPLEKVIKAPIFGCRMCGQCVLHSTGMVCPMTCPKNLRNGPCGGVRLDGTCEIIPGMPCPWVLAWQRAEHMPRHRGAIESILPPLP